MKVLRTFVIGLVVLLGTCVQAQAHGGVSIGIGLGPVWFGGPWWGGYPYYYRPYPYYYAAPVIVQPAPVYPVAVAQPAAQPACQTLPPAPAPVTARSPVQDSNQAEAERLLQQLSAADEHVRADSAIQLGRLRSPAAIDPLVATLAGDRSPTVREAAARALGLIGSSRTLAALQRAAQADPDRDVRHSAQFAAEVVSSYQNP